MKKVFLRTVRAACTLVLAVAFVPVPADAHATPIAYVPESSTSVPVAPQTVQVTFSERIEQGASAITVKGPDGSVITVGATAISSDKKTASVGIRDGGPGKYTVIWSVVSADDGHFTKGGSVFEVGTNAGATSTPSGREHLMQTEVVQTSSQAEAFAIFVELLGNGLMWAVLVAFLFVLRARAGNNSHGRSLERVLNVTIATGVVLALLGELGHIVFKTRELALLREMPFAQAFPLYLATTAGYATVIRAGATAVFAAAFFVRRPAFFAPKGINATHIVLVLLLSVFAYSRAMVSHATANSFHPEISVWVNFVHLVAKGFWTGAAALMLALLAWEKTRPVALSAFRPYLVCMAIDFLAIVLSGTYIVWLHLKSFGNITSTLWGETFVQLLSVSIFLAGIFAYHALALRYRPGRLRSTIAITLALEFVVGVCVLYLSALMIITSPPLHGAAVASAAVDNGVTISLVRDQFEDGKFLVTADSSDETDVPVVTVEDMSDDTGPIGVTLEKRFDGGYVFPAGVLGGRGPFSVDITVQQKKGYDAHAVFVLEATQTAAEQSDAPRHLDSFTIAMLLIALLGAVVAVLLWMVLALAGPLGLPDARSLRVGLFAKGAILGICVCLIVPSAASVVFGNSYKKRCLMEGNMWHLMLPVKAGIPVSSTPQEGCMALMGLYQFPDEREYRYYMDMPQATATFGALPSRPKAGVRSLLTFSLKDPDGAPAALFEEHERLLHVVIVSRDMREFAHIHPQDFDVTTAAQMKDSTFSVPYVFGRGGEYLVSIDYSHGLVHESRQFPLTVAGPAQDVQQIYEPRGRFGIYDVQIDTGVLFAGQPENIVFTISNEGVPANDLVQYLGAAMHIAIVKNDLSAFVHTHGEYHAPGTPSMPVVIKDGKIIHTMAMNMPAVFGSPLDAHLIFPSAGDYTVFGEFKNASGTVTVGRFSIRVE